LEEIVYEYNKRGNSERKFSFLKGEFGWKWPPFQWMEENNVFLIIAALANNIFVAIGDLFRKTVPYIKSNSRLKEFKFVFVDVACAFLNDTYTFYSKDIDYDLLI